MTQIGPCHRALVPDKTPSSAEVTVFAKEMSAGDVVSEVGAEGAQLVTKSWSYDLDQAGVKGGVKHDIATRLLSNRRQSLQHQTKGFSA